jgi:hypothetical protein
MHLFDFMKIYSKMLGPAAKIIIIAVWSDEGSNSVFLKR